jgi:hypothetical protein
MATINISGRDRLLSGTIASTPEPSWIAKALSGMMQGWRAHLRYQRLSKMNNEALQKRGLKRDQIAHHAFFGEDDV